MNFIDYPHIVGTTEERLESIEKYLFRQADNLNYNFTQATPDKIFELAAQAVEGAKSPAAEPGEKANYTALRDLIIKSAGSVVQTGENFTYSLDGEYVAVSEFGEFKKNTNQTITANSENITSLFTKNEEISAQNKKNSEDLKNYKLDMKNYISAGYDDVGDTFALDVGLLKGKYTKDGAIIEIASPKKVRITPDKISFFDGTEEVAYLKEKAIYFPKAHITGGTISIANGTFGVDAEGRMTATGATVEGKIIATSLELKGTAIPSTAVDGIDDYARTTDVDETLTNYAKSADVNETLKKYAKSEDLKIYIKQGETIGSTPAKGATGVSISNTGLLQASNAVIYGKIYATDGEFTGVVKATSGSIGGWNIGKQPDGSRYKGDESIYKEGDYNGVTYAVGLKATFGSPNYANYYVAKKENGKWSNVFSVNNKGEATSSDGTKKTVIGSGQIDVYGTVSSSVKKFGTIVGATDGNIDDTKPMFCIQSTTSSAGIAISVAADAWYVMYREAVQQDSETDARHAFYGDVHMKNKLYVAGSMYTGGNMVICGEKYLYAGATTRSRLIGLSSSNNVVIGYTGNSGNVNVYAAGNKTISLEAGTVKANGTTLATGSDARIKNTVCGIDEKYTAFFKLLRPVTFKYNNGRSGRLHVGFIAQEVLQALEKSGLTSQDFAGYVKAESDTEGLDGYELLIRYSEFTALNTFMIQRLIEEYRNLKNELLLLKAERTA